MVLESVKEIMVRSLVTATPSTPVRDVAKIMRGRNVGSVLIVDDSGKLVGIFTERDLVKVVAEGGSLDDPVEKYMTRNLVVAHEGEPLAKIASKMLEHWVRHIPVVDDSGKPIGIVSIRDVLRHLLASCLFP